MGHFALLGAHTHVSTGSRQCFGSVGDYVCGRRARVHRGGEAQLENLSRQGQYEKASQLRFATMLELEKQLPLEGDPGDSEDAEVPLVMLHDWVTSTDITLHGWGRRVTGILCRA